MPNDVDLVFPEGIVHTVVRLLVLLIDFSCVGTQMRAAPMSEQDIRVELSAAIGVDTAGNLLVTPKEMRSNYKLHIVLMHYTEMALHRRATLASDAATRHELRQQRMAA